jgi:diguanylate cyclase (GGDEF)-like protein
VNVSRRTEVMLGLVFPLLVVGALAAVALNTMQPGTALAFMASAPMFAAMFTRALFSGIVALLTVLVAGVTAAAAYGQQFADALPVLVGVIVGAGIAVLASQTKAMSARPVLVASSASSSSGQASVAASVTDELTGLPTRHAISLALGGANQAGTRVIALMDCDEIGTLNAERGRDIGDVFLFAAAGRTRYALPEQDSVARWGGDELLVVIDGDLASTRDLLDLITDKINKNPIRTDEGLIPLTISVGATEWPPGEDFAEATARARRAVYRAKSEGAARLVISEVSGR